MGDRRKSTWAILEKYFAKNEIVFLSKYDLKLKFRLNELQSISYIFKIFSPRVDSLTPTLSGFEILNDANLTIQNWQLTRLFASIFHYPNFSEEHKKKLL